MLKFFSGITAILFSSLLFGQDPIPASTGGKFGFVNRDHVFVIAPIYDSAGFFVNGFADVYIDQKAGIINLKGDMISKVQWSSVRFDDDQFATVMCTDSIGYVNIETGFVIAPKYKDDDLTFSEGLMGVQHFSGKWGFIDTLGKVAIPFIYDFVHGFNNGEASVRLGLKDMQINKLGKIVKTSK